MLDLGQGALLHRLGGDGSLYCADENVLGGVIQLDKLQKLGLVPAVFQQVGTNGIGGEGAEPLPHDPVAGKQGQLLGRKLAVQFMLTAGHGEDHLRTPGKGIEQRVIRSGIAGVEGHHHIHVKGSRIAVDVPQFKAQALVAVFLRRGVAFFDHVRFEIQPDDLRVDTPHLSEVIIQNEGEIGFTAPEIDDVQRFGRFFPQLVVDHLQEAVDLLILAVHGGHHLALGGEDPHIHQGRNDLSLGKEVLLLAVVGLRLLHSGGALLDGIFASAFL